ncbi:MAG: hypothetical protein QM758_00430 [Armatimonas sp.]
MGCDVLQGQRPDDVHSVRSNEFLILPVAYCLNGSDTSITFPGQFIGIVSGGVTTTANVAVVPGIDQEYEQQIREYLQRTGWEARIPSHLREDAPRRIRETTQKAAKGHQRGTILEWRENGIQPRPLLRSVFD